MEMTQDISSIVAALKKMPYLAKSNDAALQGLAEIVTLRHVAEGENLIVEGDTIEEKEEAYLLFSGVLVVEKQRDDRKVLIAVITPGSIVGEMALLTREPRSATVRAQAESVVAVLDKKAFNLFRGSGPEVAEQLMRDMTRRQRNALNRMQSAKVILMPTRLAIVLADLKHDFGVEQGDGSVLIDMPVKTSDLSDLAICPLEEAESTLKEWESVGFIKREDAHIRLLKPEEF